MIANVLVVLLSAFTLNTAQLAESVPLSIVVQPEEQTAEETPNEFYVSPEGSPDGDGSRARPWDLATALNHPSTVQPGDIIWLLEGTYIGEFTSILTGEDGARIVVRQYPGMRATIDGALTVQGAWTDYWGFEITNSNPDISTDRSTGISIFAPYARIINLAVHDTGQGMGFWIPALYAEVSGNLIYHNGMVDPVAERSHGHGIYMQNREGTKRLLDNIIFNQFRTGVHGYTQQGALSGFYLEGNVSFNNGAPNPYSQGRNRNYLIGGYQPAERIEIVQNHSYHDAYFGGDGFALGYNNKENKDLTFIDNYAVSYKPLSVKWWQDVTVTGNTLYTHKVITGGTGEGLSVLIQTVSDSLVELDAYEWNNNRYYANRAGGTGLFQAPTLWTQFERWQQETGFDLDSQYISPGTPLENIDIFVRPNQYEPDRGHVIIYNWREWETVEVDVSSILEPGDRYRIQDAQNFFGPPVLSGVYDGSPLTLPLNLSDVTQPIGDLAAQVSHTALEFNVFVIMPDYSNVAGDGNGDRLVDAGDITASVLEVFDGDGSYWLDVPDGSFHGDPVGSDANGDHVVDAGDVVCTSLLVFGQPCGGDVGGVGAVTLQLPDPIQSLPDGNVEIPISFHGQGSNAAAIAFSLQIDPAALQFNGTDANGDGMPDGLTVHLPGEFRSTAQYDPQTGLLQVMVADTTAPFTALPEGELATLRFQVSEPQTLSDLAIYLANDPAPTAGSITGQSLPMDVRIGDRLMTSWNTLSSVFLPVVSR